MPWNKMPTEISWRMKITEAIFASRGWRIDVPVQDLPDEAIEYLLYAPKDEKVVVRYRHERGENSYVATFEGVVTNLERRFKETESEYIRTELEKFMVQKPCPTCQGPAAATRGAGGDRRRAEHLRGRDAVGDRCARLGGRARRTGHRARADDRPPGPEGDRGEARVPRRRRARLPHRRPGERQPVGRRGAADPARDPDRDDADGRAVHPRRAVDRPPPAGQRQADRHADPAARPRQHRARRRARRGDDPDRGLGHRHRARGGGARRRDHRERLARGDARGAALDHRRVPARRPPGRRSRPGAAGATASRWWSRAPASTTSATST